MNIIGDDASYIRNIIFTFASVNTDDLRGIVLNGTLYVIVNRGILYEVYIPSIDPNNTCCFFLNFENQGSFKEENMIIDYPELYGDILNKLSIIEYSARNPIFTDIDCLDESNKQFQSLSSYRANDGSMKYYIDSDLKHRSFVTISKSMFKLNKADKLSLNVFDADFCRLLYKFTLYKKKYGLNINIFLLTIDLH